VQNVFLACGDRFALVAPIRKTALLGAVHLTIEEQAGPRGPSGQNWGDTNIF